ncbi:MAG: hypothetical protein JRG97_10750 [Deltaproteobacteria bacterium]|nr:hypothetical protein [Deltaproteobacteria bacterium]
MNRDLCKISNFVEIAEGEKLTHRNIAKYFEDLIFRTTYAAGSVSEAALICRWQRQRSGAHEVG